MQTATEKKSQRDNLLSLDEGGESNLEKPPAKMPKNTISDEKNGCFCERATSD